MIEEKVISLTKGQFVCKSKFNPDLKIEKWKLCQGIQLRVGKFQAQFFIGQF